MQRKEIIIGSVALVMATFVTFGVLKLIANPSLISNNRCEEVKYNEILVAKQDIRLGEEITLARLEYEKWPQQITRNEFFIKEKITKDTFHNQVAKRPISKGEPITSKLFIDSKNQGALAALLRPGMRAIAINVDPASISGGLIMPGDIVDVIITFTENSAGNEQKIISRTALCEVRVLALDQRISADDNDATSSIAATISAKKDQPTVARTVTLEVTPADAEVITAAVKKGTPSLSLHSTFGEHDKCRVNFYDDERKSTTAQKQDIAPPPPPAAPKSETIQIYRGSIDASQSMQGMGGR